MDLSLALMGETRKIYLSAFILIISVNIAFTKNSFVDSTHVYNEHGQVAYIEFRNYQSTEVWGHQNWRKHFEYDEAGNRIKKYYTDLANNLIDGIRCGVTTTYYKYDAHQNMIEDSYFDSNGEPTLNSCEDVHKRVLRYDDQNRLLQELYYIVNGALKGGTNFTYLIDSDKPTRVEFFGSTYQPVGSVELEYDDQGREIYQTFLDANGYPRNGTNVVAVKKTEYFSNGTKITLLNPVGKVLKEKVLGTSIAGSE